MGIVKTIKKKFLKIRDLGLSLKDLDLKNKNIIITGSNSGIGLSLVKILSASNKVLAFVNNASNNVEKFINDKSNIIKCDLSDFQNINNHTTKILNFKPNIIINCAATFGDEDKKIENIDLKAFQKAININCLSQFALIQISLRSKKLETIANISSEMGSVSLNKIGGYYFYRSTKSLLNSISKNLSIDLKDKKINIFCIHPGSVKTKLNAGGWITPDIAAQKIINICTINKKQYSGLFIDLEKKILEW